MSILFKNDGERSLATYLSLKNDLQNAGFKIANMDAIKECASRYDRLGAGPGWKDFCVAGRGIGNSGSNYFVFFGIKKKLLGRDELQALYYNPAPPDVKFNFRDGNTQPVELKRQDTIITRAYNGKGDINSFVSETINEISGLSALKPNDRYYLWPHNHAGYIYYGGKVRRLIDLDKDEIPFAVGPLDDGKSNPFDMMMSAALFGGDFFAITSHNSFSKTVYSELDFIGKALGIAVVPGIEFTMPIHTHSPEDAAILLTEIKSKLEDKSAGKDDVAQAATRMLETARQLLAKTASGEASSSDYAEMERLSSWCNDTLGMKTRPLRVLNGPHVIAMFSSPEQAVEADSMFLRKRDVLFPPLSAPGVEFNGTIAKLKEKYGNKVFIMLAHPFCELGLPAVGVGNRMSSGDLMLASMLDIALKRLVDGIAAYNPSVTDEKHIFGFDGNRIDLDEYPPEAIKLLKAWITRRNNDASIAEAFIGAACASKWGFKAWSSNPMNIAFAYIMSNSPSASEAWPNNAPSTPEPAANAGTYLIRLGEPDTHWYGDFSLSEPEANHLMRTVSYIEGASMPKSLDSLFAALQRAKEGSIKADYFAYCQMDPQTETMKFENAREPTKHEAMDESWKWFSNYGAALLNVILPDFVKRTFFKAHLPLRKLDYLWDRFLKE